MRSAASSGGSTRSRRTSCERLEQSRGSPGAARASAARGSAEERERTDTAAREVAVERDRVEEEARAAGEEHEAMLAGLRALETETPRRRGGARRASSPPCTRSSCAPRRAGSGARSWCRRRGGSTRWTPTRCRGVTTPRAISTPRGAACAELDDEARGDRRRQPRGRRRVSRARRAPHVPPHAARRSHRLDQGSREGAAWHDAHGPGAVHPGVRRRSTRHFGEIFERLFEGGRAELRLVEAEEGGDPLDTGVELMAQPRGKRLQAVTLMSGGERALTGLALLFAIFYFRPSPFCVLDEVDAPLDDANIHRFLRVLRELTTQTQFLVITHNRKTMEAADILYGVTMEEPGLSKLVSVNLGAASERASRVKSPPADRLDSAARAAMPSVGAHLRQLREARGVSLEEIARVTRVDCLVPAVPSRADDLRVASRAPSSHAASSAPTARRSA